MWFEISEIEYQFVEGTEAVQARFKADMTEPRRQWYPVWIPGVSGSDPEPGQVGKAYHRYLEWHEKGQVLLGRLGVRDGSDGLEVIGIKTQAR